MKWLLSWAAELDKEQEEKKESEASVATFRRQLASVKEKCASLDVEIEQHRIITANLMRGMSFAPTLTPPLSTETYTPPCLAERKREHSILTGHASRTQPEVETCEDRLKCAIEGIDKDKIFVRFTHIDPADLAREFSLVVDVSSRAYKGMSPLSSAREWR